MWGLVQSGRGDPPDGLVGLMFDFGIGVNPVNAYEVNRVDTGFFS
jgi:restriction endonuclease Mrr